MHLCQKQEDVATATIKYIYKYLKKKKRRFIKCFLLHFPKGLIANNLEMNHDILSLSIKSYPNLTLDLQLGIRSKICFKLMIL